MATTQHRGRQTKPVRQASLKYCPRCFQYKPLSEFDSKGPRQPGRDTYCRSCRAIWRRSSEPSALRHEEKARSARLRREYGITVEDYDAMLDFQEGGCAICGALPKTRRLAIDHDHHDGHIRGLLCFRCNTLLDKNRDDADLLEAAAEYLRHPPAVGALGEEKFVPAKRPKRRRRRKRK